MDGDKECYYYVKYYKQKLKNEYEARLERATSSDFKKQIKKEHEKKWKEFCENNSEKYDAYLRVKSHKRAQQTCLICFSWFWINKCSLFSFCICGNHI